MVARWATCATLWNCPIAWCACRSGWGWKKIRTRSFSTSSRRLNDMSARLLPWAIAALYLLFLFPTPEFPPYNADDGSWFVTMGWNLAHYGRYTSDTYPLAEYGHHAAWPPLFAGLCSPR